MTENFYRTENYNADHRTFGGTICSSDFNTDFRGKDNDHGSSIAKRIMSDWNFDEYCKKNIEGRTRSKNIGEQLMANYIRKGYTLEFNLREYGYNNYYAVCTYKYDKKKEKYSLSMWIKRKDINDKFKIDSQEIDTQYINGTKETIEDNIDRVIEQAGLSGFFDEYIQRYEYTYKCCDIGDEILTEKEKIIKANAS